MTAPAIEFPTECNTFASRHARDAYRAAIDHIMKALASGATIANVSVGFTPVRAGNVAIGDDDYAVVTVITDLRNIPQAASDPRAGVYAVTGGDVRYG
jgi:hypothetical protein